MKTSLLFKISLLGLVSTAAYFGTTQLRQNNVSSPTTTPIEADLVVSNAKIFTSDQQQPWAEAVAIKDGRFIYVGDTLGINKYQSDTVVNLNGKLVVPGMIDSHAHPGYVNVEQFGEVEGETAEELLESVKAYAQAHPHQEWLRLCCWPTDMFVQGAEGPNKATLDAVVPDRLVWFESETAHDFWLNSAALAQLGLDHNTPDPRPGLAAYVRDAEGNLTGWIKEGAGVQHFAKEFAVVDETHIQRHRQSVLETLQTLSRHGVTTIFDAGNKGFGDLTYSVIAQLEKEGTLPVRYFGTYQIFTPGRAKTAIEELKRYRREYAGDLLQFKTVKLFMDGITANRSAAYLQPYKGETRQAETMLSVEELRDLLLQLHNEKLDLHVHTIGDLAVRIVLDAVESAQAMLNGDFYPRVTVAHLALISPDDLPRLKELGVIANFTPWWFGASPEDVAPKLLGQQRYENMYRANSVIKSGARYTFSSDEWWGGDMLATYISPYLGMQVGHTRQYPRDWWTTEDDGVKAPINERMSLPDLITGYTRNGAYQLRLEHEIGSIEQGKQADFVVLDQNLFEIKPQQILATKPLAVVMQGRVVQGSLAANQGQ